MNSVHSVALVGVNGLSHAVDAANALPPAPPAQRHLIDPVCYHHLTQQALACTGRVKRHADKDFPQWAGILILRCGERAVLRVQGAAAVALEPGLAISFNAHRQHSVDQERNDVLVWLPVYDDHTPLDAGDLLAMAQRRFLPRTTHSEAEV